MGGKSGPDEQTTTQTQTRETRLPEWLQPTVTRAVNQASDLFDAGPAQYGPAPVVALGADSLGALNQMRGLAANNPAAPGMAEWQRTVGGDYLYGGPGFDAAYQAASNRIIPQVQSAFSRAGRTDSGLADVAMTQALGDAFASQYGAERGRQMTALGMTPQMQNAATMPAQWMANVGNVLDAQAQREADAQYAYDRRQALGPAQSFDEWLSRLGALRPLVGLDESGTSMETVPLYDNTTGQVLGTIGTIAGAALGGPMGASIGSSIGSALGGGGGPSTYGTGSGGRAPQLFNPSASRGGMLVGGMPW